MSHRLRNVGDQIESRRSNSCEQVRVRPRNGGDQKRCQRHTSLQEACKSPQEARTTQVELTKDRQAVELAMDQRKSAAEQDAELAKEQCKCSEQDAELAREQCKCSEQASQLPRDRKCSEQASQLPMDRKCYEQASERRHMDQLVQASELASERPRNQCMCSERAAKRRHVDQLVHANAN